LLILPIEADDVNPFYPRCPTPGGIIGCIALGCYEFLTFSMTFKPSYIDPEL